MTLDSYKWLPPTMKVYYANVVAATPAPEFVPWTPMAKPLGESRIALVTTAGINVRGIEPPFDYEREQREPQWGDPTFRTIPSDVHQSQIQSGHLHINNADIDADLNVAIPLARMMELEAAGVIGSLAGHNYSFMGFQPSTAEWESSYGPEVAKRLRDDAVDGVLLTPV